MNPGMALPEPAPLPADPWLLWSLLMLTFTLHVLPMNFVLGGSIVALVSRFQGRRGDLPHHDALTSWLARAMPVAIATAVTMGVAAFLIHANDPWTMGGGASKEPALLYLIGFLPLFFTGAGRFSVDNMIVRRGKQA